uniref:Uncharacterized protein n=1 Tax=Arundo donax TaxID=35708 RepID=A0A0A9DRZ1_ARUDO
MSGLRRSFSCTRSTEAAISGDEMNESGNIMRSSACGNCLTKENKALIFAWCHQL